MFRFFILFLIFSTCSVHINGDTPANCTYDDIRGSWTFFETQRSFDRNVKCDNQAPGANEVRLELLFPDIAVDEFGNKGKWTIIYNQGFEVQINYRKYFAFSAYKQNGSTVISYCHRTLPGYAHDILGNNWSCFTGRKQNQLQPKISHSPPMLESSEELFRNDQDFIKQINNVQKSWKAAVYPHFENLSHRELHLMRGGPRSRIMDPPKPRKASSIVKRDVKTVPLEFDWRNVNGVNYVSPVRNQGACGSCYAFSSVGMIESRLKVQTNNTVNLQLSTQDIVSCSRYSQGCEGGFPYLVAGKYGQDYGFIQEKCDPYVGSDVPCHEKKCLRHYTARYGYVGGFYGACNEELMMIELVRNGPMSVSFEVYSDFQYYKSGIYHHTGLESSFNPFEITNHAVLLVGYGQDASTGEKFWIVKNSWGENWGENGFFRIRKGTDECSIESIAVEATPIP
ncbi:Dipeptidyl peptidase 1-like protein [Dinothrombium tinctorium]|uniref:Dipeptidyl peptidase 1 n=1 Tax=Dinothrombium tinctorium TaxID=1965070 RepID=A0A443QV58_9ACAR|nr:Dipeptidyl peptidase 1-like protein [Dinothrombium tinctorium]